jgi:hypothetical protein
VGIELYGTKTKQSSGSGHELLCADVSPRFNLSLGRSGVGRLTPGVAKVGHLSPGFRRVDKEGSGVLRVSPIGDLEGT